MVAALFRVPQVGLASVTVMMVVYALLLRRMPAESPCACFGGFLASTNQIAIVRNVILAGSATGAAIVALGTDLRDGLLSQRVAGASFVGVAILFGLLHVLKSIYETRDSSLRGVS